MLIPVLSHLRFRLLFDVPTEQSYAGVLKRAYSRFPELYLPIELPKDIDLTTDEGRKAYEAWVAKSDREFLERAFERWALKDEVDPAKKALLLPEASARLRMVLASKVPSYRRELRDWLERHEDKWVRIGAAIAKDFYTAEEVRTWYEREGWSFLFHVHTNRSLHLRSKPAVVAEVRNLLSRSDEAEAQGYDWEDTQFTCSWWSQEAANLHRSDPERYMSWDERPEARDEEPSDDPTIGVLKRLSQEIEQLRQLLFRLRGRITVALVCIVVVGLLIIIR
jgi:hypothetical protein